MSGVHLYVLCARQIVSRKNRHCLCCVEKKTKFGAKKELLTRHFLIFLTQDMKNVGIP